MTPDSNDLINQDMFDELEEMLGEKMGEVVGTYLKNSANYVADIADGADQKDAEKVENAAHALKSSSRYLGFYRLGELCEAAETIARDEAENAEKLSSLKHQVQEQFAQVETLMRERGYA